MTTQTQPTWTLSDRLVKARTFANLTQAEMADRLGIGRRTVARHEGDESPPLAFVYSYAAATGVPIEWLLGDQLISRCLSPPSLVGQLEFVMAA